MFTTKKQNSVVGLDIEAGSIAATEVRGNGSRRLGATAIVPLQPGVMSEGEVQDPQALSRALRDLFAKNKLGKHVRLGIANQRVVVRTIQLPLIEDEDELDNAIRFRAQDDIPMPLDEAVLDHRVISKGSGAEGERQMQVLAVAARRDMVSGMLDALRKAGLEPAGIDLSAFGMIRALDQGTPAPAVEGPEQPLTTTTLYCHLGDVTNLAVARGGECLFSRVAPFGLESIAQRLAGRDGSPLDDARDFLVEVGLEDPVDLFDEQASAASAREVLEEGASKLVDELRMSLDFYGAQEGVPAIDQVVVCGPGSMIPGLPERIQVGLGLGIEAEVPGALSHLDEEDAARLTVSYGLALEG